VGARLRAKVSKVVRRQAGSHNCESPGTYAATEQARRQATDPNALMVQLTWCNLPTRVRPLRYTAAPLPSLDPRMHIESFTCLPAKPLAGQPCVLELVLAIDGALVFAPDVGLELFAAGCEQPAYQTNLLAQVHVGWLPRGRYRVRWMCADGLLAQRVRVSVHCRQAMHEAFIAAAELQFADAGVAAVSDAVHGHWQIAAIDDTPALDTLSWHRGHGDWFFRHFDHAASVVVDYMLGNSPLLRGRVLDVGCGDGITALGVALRCQPEQLIGIDPFGGFARLPEILQHNGLSPAVIPDALTFMAADANDLPFADDSFDVVVSWGSLEHIAGGYARALREIRRVLRADGLLFVHPGLFYSNFGHHLGEFSAEPHFHLKKSPAALRELVFAKSPEYIDRSGEFASPAQYWQWYQELNPITVAGFERELRALDFEPWRVAIRSEDRIEYSPELLPYPMQDLATLELYLSCYNRKHRPGSVPPARIPDNRQSAAKPTAR